MRDRLLSWAQVSSHHDYHPRQHTTTEYHTAPHPSVHSAATSSSYSRLQDSQPHENAIMRAPNGYLEPTPEAGNAMPYDKPTTPRTLAPTLSHSNMRAGNTTPLTPRVAGTTPSNVSTPLLRRATRPDTSMASPPRDEGATPIGNMMSSNITPHSGSRNTRVNSANTTPSGTPNGTPQSEAFAGEILSYGGGSGRSMVDSPYLKPAAAFSSSGRPQIGGSRDRTQSQDDGGKFFYASDVKASPAPPTRPRPLAHKQSGFLHAKGSSSKAGGSMVSGYSSGASSIGRSDEREKPKSKFFHANGTPDATLPLPSAGYSRAGSTVSSVSIAQPPRLAAPQKSRSIPRPVSLQKMDNTTSYFSPKAVASAQASPVLALPTASPQLSANRRSVQEDRPEPRRVMSGHKKSQSMSQSVSIMGVRSSAGSSLGSDVSFVGPSQPQYLAEVVNTPEVSTPVAETPAEEDESTGTSVIDKATIASGLQSPLKDGGNIERMNELAAEARRERKVMDLEITNSSLAAINRTLEREMRKQKAELQRYRRLSRSGRLSIIPDGSSKPKKLRQSLLSALSELAEEDEDMDEDDDEDLEDEDETEEGEDDDDIDSTDDAELSPAALAESDARHQKRDEQRLALDLSKHQQLLVDSQKMNQSLKKCLGWTEELIKDGKKALAYRVHAEDVKLGGRILVDDDHEEHDEHEGENEEHGKREDYFVLDGPNAPTYTVGEEVDTMQYGRGISSTTNNKDRPSEDFQSDP